MPTWPRARAPGCSSGWPTCSTHRGEYARAAECLREANAISKELAKGNREYVPAEHERFVDGLIRLFDSEFFARNAGSGHDSRRPVFVFGLPRSGTTLVEQVLSSHSADPRRGRAPAGPADVRGHPRHPRSARVRPSSACPSSTARHSADSADLHLERLRAIAGDRTDRVVDKMPDNYMYLGILWPSSSPGRPSSIAVATCAISPSPAG